ncbi:MAG: hypothetical protein RMI51_05285 [Aquificaceae bacterium]|nr:hypothetical protein [Aquificaceae bacterium]
MVKEGMLRLLESVYNTCITLKSLFLKVNYLRVNLKGLELSIGGLINLEEDYVVTCKLENEDNLNRKSLGIDFDPTFNIL